MQKNNTRTPKRFGKPQRNPSNKNTLSTKGIITEASALANFQGTMMHIPRSVGAYMPDRLRTTLRFWKSVAISLSPLTYSTVRFTPTNVYDPDPSGGVTKPAGFAELAAIYGSYRPLSSFARAEFYNEGDVTTRVCLLPTNLDPGASPSANYVISSVEQPYAVSKTLSSVGGPITQIQNKMSSKKIFGSPMTDFDDNFAALSNTFPNNNWFWVLTLYAMSVATKAVVLNFYCEIEVDFYDRVYTLRA